MRTKQKGLIQKQANYLLNNRLVALVITAVMAYIPFTAWIALSLVSLFTLRKGMEEGGYILLVSLIGVLCAGLSIDVSATSEAALLLLMTYVFSSCLRITVSWSQALAIHLFIASLGIVLIHLYFPEYIDYQVKMVLDIVHAMNDKGLLADIFSHEKISATMLGNYIIGLKSISLYASVVFSVALARSIQANLFNPGAFKRELFNIRAYRVSVLLLIMAITGTYSSNAVLTSLLPLVAIYLMIAGMSLVSNFLQHKKDLFILVLLLGPLVLVPYIMLPAYVFLGMLDSIFNLRMFPLKRATKE